MTRDHHLVPEGFEQFHRLHAQRHVERVGELVDKQVHAAVRGRLCPFHPAREPSAKRRAMQVRQRPGRREAHEPFDELRYARRRHGEVVGPWREAPPPHRGGRTGDQAAPQWHALHIVQMLLPLGLQSCHVDVGRTLALAGLTGEAEVHHVGDFGLGPGVGRLAGRGERLPQHVGPRPRGVLFVPRRHVAGAHRAPHRGRLAALPHACALLRRAEHAPGVGKAKHRVMMRFGLAGENPQRRVHRRRIDDLARIEDPLRVEQPLHPLEQLEAFVADHRADEFTAEAAIAVLAAQATAVLLHERRHVGGHIAKHGETGGRAEIEERPEMQFARAGVGVVDAFDAVFFGEQPVELGDVGRQVLDRHGRVLHDLPRLGVARHVIHEPLAGPPQLPDLVAVGAAEHGVGVAEACAAELILDLLKLRRHSRAIGVLHLHDQDRPGIADHERPVAGLFGVVLRAVEDLLIDQFTGREHACIISREIGIRPAAVPHRDERGPQRLVHGRAVHHHQRARRRQRDEVQLIFNAEEQRALGAGQQPTEIEGPLAPAVEDLIKTGCVHEGIERIPRVAAGDLGPRIRLADELAVGGITKQGVDCAVDPRFEGVWPCALLRELVARERAKRHLRAVGKKTPRPDQVVAGGAVGDRVRAAGVVAHHAAEHRPGRGRCFGAKEEPERREMLIERVADHARLHADGVAIDVDRQDPIQVAARIDNDPAAHHLPGQRRAGSTGNQTDAMLRRKPHEFADVGLRSGERHRDGPFLILRRVGRIDRPREVVDEQITLEAGRESHERRC